MLRNKNKFNNLKDEQEQQNDQGTTENEFNESTITKRHYDDYDSESEQKPQTKKKKKRPMPSDSTYKKGKKSIRQMKWEKHTQRIIEARAAIKDHVKNQCLVYLSQWKHDKQNWKFMKAKQLWLYKNKFSLQMIPEESWPLLLEYFESAVGNIRNMMLEDAYKIIKQMDEWTETHGSNGDENEETETVESKKPDTTIYRRARDIIQCLQE